MNWLLPSALAIGGVAAVAVFALHFLSRSRPLAEPLPTTRFIPLRPVHARARSIVLSDTGLLLMRIAAVLALALAVAGPMLSHHGVTARVVLVDRSRAVGDLRAALDSARAAAGAAGSVILFDSAAMTLPRAAGLDSVRATAARGSLSAGLAAARRVASDLAARSDAVELAVISPFAAEEFDEATPRLRAAWPGRIRVVRLPAAAMAPWTPAVEVNAPANDAIAAGMSLMGVMRSPANVRLVRGAPTAGDSAWARDSGHVLLVWPALGASVAWVHRAPIDAVGGVSSHTGTLVARFPRPWTVQGAAVARWSDGEAAVVERALGQGCVRDVSVLVDEASDITLRPPFRAFTRALLDPCGGAPSLGAAPAAAMAYLTTGGSLAAASALRDGSRATSPYAPWLYALAALLLIVELAMRRSQRSAASARRAPIPLT